MRGKALGTLPRMVIESLGSAFDGDLDCVAAGSAHVLQADRGVRVGGQTLRDRHIDLKQAN